MSDIDSAMLEREGTIKRFSAEDVSRWAATRPRTVCDVMGIAANEGWLITENQARQVLEAVGDA